MTMLSLLMPTTMMMMSIPKLLTYNIFFDFLFFFVSGSSIDCMAKQTYVRPSIANEWNILWYLIWFLFSIRRFLVVLDLNYKYVSNAILVYIVVFVFCCCFFFFWAGIHSLLFVLVDLFPKLSFIHFCVLIFGCSYARLHCIAIHLSFAWFFFLVGISFH